MLYGPPLIRLTDLGIRLVDKEIIEAAESFGASKKQKLWGVQIPLALPNIMQGINQCTMMALAMVVIASMIGTRGLGDEVLRFTTIKCWGCFRSWFSNCFIGNCFR